VVERLFIDDPSPGVRESAAMVLGDLLEPRCALDLLDRGIAQEGTPRCASNWSG